MIDSLIEQGIEPMIILHHFHPIWFEEKGGFYIKENILTLRLLQPHIPIFC